MISCLNSLTNSPSSKANHKCWFLWSLKLKTKQQQLSKNVMAHIPHDECVCGGVFVCKLRTSTVRHYFCTSSAATRRLGASHWRKVEAGCWRWWRAGDGRPKPLSASPETPSSLCFHPTPVLLPSGWATPPSARPGPPAAAPGPSRPPPGTTEPSTGNKSSQQVGLAFKVVSIDRAKDFLQKFLPSDCGHFLAYFQTLENFRGRFNQNDTICWIFQG